MTQILKLINHFELPITEYEESLTLKLDDVLRYSGYYYVFGEVQEEVQLWSNLLELCIDNKPRMKRI